MSWSFPSRTGCRFEGFDISRNFEQANCSRVSGIRENSEVPLPQVNSFLVPICSGDYFMISMTVRQNIFRLRSLTCCSRYKNTIKQIHSHVTEISAVVDPQQIKARSSCHAMPCHAMPCHAMPCHAMPCHAMPCHAMPCYAMLCYAMLCYAMLRSAMLCYATLCYAMLFYAMLHVCHAMPCHAMPCHAMPCHAMPCHAMPCHAMPCHATQRHARLG